MNIFTTDLNKAAIAMANIIDQLNELESKMNSYFDIYDYKEAYFSIAYYARISILDRIERNNWPLNMTITIPRGLFKVHKTNILKGLDLTVKKLERLVADDHSISECVEGILKRNEYFIEFDSIIPESEKAKM